MLARRILRSALLATLPLALALPAGPAQARSSGTAMVAYINAYRAKHGLPAVRSSRSLSRTARRKAIRILRTNRFSHSAMLSGYRLTGEALAWHSGRRARVRRTFLRWAASPSHRALLLSRRFRHIGARRAVGRLGSRTATVWVLRLGRR